jgi:hypothetical protein
MGDTWIIDLEDLSGLRDPLVVPTIPNQARRIGEYVGSIVESATAGWDHGMPAATAVKCRRRPGRRPCGGIVRVVLSEVPEEIVWGCSRCDDRGVIRSWRNSPWDLSGIAPRHGQDDQWVEVELSEVEHRALCTIPVYDPEAERVVKGARAVDHAKRVLIGSPRAMMDHLCAFVMAEANAATDSRREALLDTIVLKLEAA